MKNLARLIIFFSLAFVILFICSGFFRFLSSWIDSVRVISNDTERGGMLLSSFSAALPISLFIGILLALSYSVRRKIPAVSSIITVFLLSVIFCYGIFFGIERIRVYDPGFLVNSGPQKRSGLILSQQDTRVVLLGDSNTPAGYPRVLAFPERPLVYQESALGPVSATITLPIEKNAPWFIQSILIDFSLTAREFDTRYAGDPLSFLAYVCSLLLFLACLRFLFGLSSWPMANLLFGFLVFRLVLSLVVFLNSTEVQTFLITFANKRIPDYLTVPFVFLVLSAAVILYTFLAFLARRKSIHNDSSHFDRGHS